MKIRTLMGLAAALCVAAVLSVPRGSLSADEAGAVKLIGNEKAVSELVQADVKELQSILSAGAPEKKNLKRAKVLAMVIGLNTQAIGKGEAMAIHDQAGKVLEALGKDDLAAAKEASKAMTTAKNGGGKAHDVVKGMFDADPTVNDWDRDLVMQLFKTPRAGGIGIENKIKAWAEKAPVGKDLELAANYAQKSAMIGLALQRMAPPAKQKQLTADWKKLAEDMTSASEEAYKLASAEKKDGKALMASMSRIDKACTVCHEKFK